MVSITGIVLGISVTSFLVVGGMMFKRRRDMKIAEKRLIRLLSEEYGSYLRDTTPIFSEQRRTGVYDFDSLVKNAQDLEILMKDKENYEAYKKIFTDKELVAQLKVVGSREEAKKVMEEWLVKKKEEQKNAKKVEGKIDSEGSPDGSVNGDGNGSSGGGTGTGNSGTAGTSGDGSVNGVNGEKKSRGRRALDKIKVSKEYERAPESEVKPAGPGVIEMSEAEIEKAIGMYRRIEYAINEKDIDNIVNIIKNLSDEGIDSLVNGAEKKIVEQRGAPYAKTERLFARAAKKEDIILAIKKEFIEGLKIRLTELKDKISYLRKKGFEMKHEDILIMMVPPKIIVFEATFDKVDFAKIQEVMQKVEIELKLKQQLQEQKEKDKLVKAQA